MSLPELHAISGKKTLYWQVFWKENTRWTQSYAVNAKGQKSKIKVSRITETTAKNIGKKNARSAVEQAEFEATRLWEKKKRNGYIEEDERPLDRAYPTLLARYTDEKYTDNLYASRKFDGIRAILRYNETEERCELTTRNNKQITGFDNIIDRVLCDMCDVEQYRLFFDGELYIHGSSLQNIQSIVMNKSCEEGKDKVSFYVFDVPDLDGELTFEERQSYMDTMDWQEDSCVKRVQHTKVESKQHIAELHDAALDEGYEGLVLREGSQKYKLRKDYRDPQVMKLKKVDTGEGTIIGMKQGKGANEGAAIFAISDEGGLVFDCTPTKVTIEQRRAMFLDKSLIGKKVKYEYRGLYDSGKPMHAVVVNIIGYKV